MPKRKLDEDLLNESIVDNLECQVCYELLGPPIHQCTNGHIICTKCKTNLTRCPTCNCCNLQGRNLILEKIYKNLKLPCKFRVVGCDEVLSEQFLKDHQNDCTHQCVTCNFPMKISEKCNWSGKVDSLYQHVQNHHPDTIIVDNEKTSISDHKFSISLDLARFCVRFGFRDKVFELAVILGVNRVQAGVLYYGGKTDTKKYKYKITITSCAESEKDVRTLSYSNHTHWYHHRDHLLESDSKCFDFERQFLQEFASKGGCIAIQADIQEI